MPDTIAIKVSKAAERAILDDHPWVYKDAMVKQNKDGQAGDVAVIYSQKGNKLLAIGLYDPHSSIGIRILSVKTALKIDQSFFNDRLNTALKLRKTLLTTKTTAYRLIYGENDRMPGLIIDCYNDVAVIKLYSAIWVPYLDDLVNALKHVVNSQTILLRLARQVASLKLEGISDGTILQGDLRTPQITFLEHGLEFNSDLIKGHKTGYFLDHRHNRLQVRQMSKGKHVLDVFSYAGGFATNAAAGGAKSVTCIDISEKALQLAKANIERVAPNVKAECLAGDAFYILNDLSQKEKKYDLLIIDPPSFANNDEQVPSAKAAYIKLLGLATKVICKGGILLMASCTARVSAEDYFEMITNFLNHHRISHKVLFKKLHDIDHPERIRELSYLKSIYLEME